MICKFEAQYRVEKRKIFGDSEFPELDYKGRNTAEMDFEDCRSFGECLGREGCPEIRNCWPQVNFDELPKRKRW